MIRIRRGVARSVAERRPGLLDVHADVDGSVEPAIAYVDLCGPVRPGDRIVLNTSAVAMGLGTGGVHFVIAVADGPAAEGPADARSMKLRYTPVQVPVPAVEEAGPPLPDTLDGLPVVAAGLHSAVAPVAIGAAARRPGVRVGLVLTDAAALPLAFSDTVAALRAVGLLHVTVTAGQAFGGDLEAVNKFTGMLAARSAGADIAIVAMGPGNLGTGSRYGFASMEVAEVVNATAALGGTPIAVARVGFADPRDRHRGLSHHTLTALADAAYARALIPIPSLAPEREASVRAALRALEPRHEVVVVDLGAAEEALRASPVPLATMGRTFDEDPDYFRVAAAAGVLAAQRE